MFEAPTTTARRPVTSSEYSFSRRITPQGVHGRKPGRFCANKPGIRRMKAIDVLGGIDGVHDLRAVETFRQRQLQQDAIDANRRAFSGR